MKNTHEIFVMPAGTYYIGDLCYVMHDEWDEFCNNDQQGILKLKDGRECCWFYTKYGDGTYEDNSNNKYGVDAGIIGCIKLEYIDQNNYENNVDLGHVHKFDQPFECKYHNGLICFGNVNIDTDPKYEEKDDWYLDDDTEDIYND